MMCDAIQTRWAGSSPRHENGAGRKQPCMFKTRLLGPKPGPDHSLLSPQVCFGRTNGFGQNNSKRMICPLQSPRLRSGRNARGAHNLLHEHKLCNGEKKSGSRLRNSKCPNSLLVQVTYFILSFKERNPPRGFSMCTRKSGTHAAFSHRTLFWWYSNDVMPSWVKLVFPQINQFRFVSAPKQLNCSCLYYLTGGLNFPLQRSGHFSSTADERYKNVHIKGIWWRCFYVWVRIYVCVSVECVSAGESKVNGRGGGEKDEVREGMRGKKGRKRKSGAIQRREGGVM